MKHDLILFGATSFVGQITARNLVARLGIDGEVSWAIAGRNADKLEAVSVDVGADVPRLIVDAADADAVAEMAASARVLASTVGPYAQYGSEVVAACAREGTDYVDLTGEPHWMAQMIDAHGQEAENSGARIVHACGFDSIPSDLGVWFLQGRSLEQYGAPASTVELMVKGMKGGASGGTIATMLNTMEQLSADRSLRKVLTNPYALAPVEQRSGVRQPNRNGIREHEDEKLWLAPFVMAATNSKVVHRTNAVLGNPWGDMLYSEEMVTGSGPLGAAKAAAVTAGLGGFMGLAALGPTRSLLDRFVLPSPGEGPSPQAQLDGYFKILIRGTTDAGEVTRVSVTGDRDPGYGSTARMLTESALTLIETPRSQTPGGFWTPASAMGDELIEALGSHAGVQFAQL
ncbi:MAG: saccharopine dehydrogenase [Acidimicrobiales bacterium]|nr:saccharopine dehydrogenase [Acidimicrobiales bacterium]